MHPIFDRTRLNIKPLKSRQSKSDTSCMVAVDAPLPPLSPEAEEAVGKLVEKIIIAKKQTAPVVMAYGAHLFKNGLSPLIVELIEAGYIQHLLTNGAGSIHDWEMAYQGKTEEDVQRYIKEGQFGIWEETGFFLNFSVILGNALGIGYGESIGKMIHEDRLEVPSIEQLKEDLLKSLQGNHLTDPFQAKAILLQTLEQFSIDPGKLEVNHPFKQFSILGAAFRSKIPFSVCPGIGADIIYTHPINSGAAIGQGSLHDFLMLAQTVSQLENGVFLSVGSAVMSPMIFEKSVSMARNIALQEKRPLENYHIVVNDIQPGTWDWTQGEPPKDHPAYYLRFCKSFSRMGGKFSYLELDNTLLIKHLHHRLLYKG